MTPHIVIIDIAEVTQSRVVAVIAEISQLVGRESQLQWSEEELTRSGLTDEVLDQLGRIAEALRQTVVTVP